MFHGRAPKGAQERHLTPLEKAHDSWGFLPKDAKGANLLPPEKCTQFHEGTGRQ